MGPLFFFLPNHMSHNCYRGMTQQNGLMIWKALISQIKLD